MCAAVDVNAVHVCVCVYVRVCVCVCVRVCHRFTFYILQAPIVLQRLLASESFDWCTFMHVQAEESSELALCKLLEQWFTKVVTACLLGDSISITSVSQVCCLVVLMLRCAYTWAVRNAVECATSVCAMAGLRLVAMVLWKPHASGVSR